MPITAQQLARRGPRTHPRQEFIFFSGQHFTLLFNSDFPALMLSIILDLPTSAISSSKNLVDQLDCRIDILGLGVVDVEVLHAIAAPLRGRNMFLRNVHAP